MTDFDHDVCVKTGLRWRERYSSTVYTGDLFRTAHGWQIRGVPDGGYWGDGGMPVDTVVAGIELTKREAGDYRDSQPGVQLRAVSDEFRKHVADWYAYRLLHLILPSERVEDGRI